MSQPTLERRVPFSALGTFPKLFTDYCTDYEVVADYYSGDWRSATARREAAERTADYERARDQVADILLEQNARWGMDEATRGHIEALRGEETVAVVTGQQVGLFTGPLYTPYKTITALQLTRQLAEETDKPVVPVFWLEGGDHDLDEVAGVKVLARNAVKAVRYAGHSLPEEGNLGPVGRLGFDTNIEDVLDALEEELPSSDFRPELMKALRGSYRPGTTMLDAFARLMRRLFPEAGLVFIDPDDARLKRLAVPLFRREIEDYATAHARLEAVSERLEDGYHAQVTTRPTNLFMLTDEGRYPLDATEDGFELRGRGQSFTSSDLHAMLDEEPGRFSPNVVLRPLMQDLLLPTAAYVAGPGEISYFAQYKPVYDWAEIPMPIIYPRASATLVEGKVQKVLDKFELDVEAFADNPDRLFQQVVKRQMSIDVDEVFKDAGRHIHEAVNALKPQVEQVDRTLVKATEATRAAMMKEWSGLKTRVLRSEKRSHDEVRDQLEKAAVNLFPNGLQERSLSVFTYLNKYSPALLNQLRDVFSLDTSAHQVIEL